MQGKAIATEINHVDIGGAHRNALLQNLGTLIDQGKHQPMDDFVVADLARFNAQLGTMIGNQLVDNRVRQRVALAGLIAVPAQTGFLTKAAQLAQFVGDLGVFHVGMLSIAALADVPADVIAGQIAHPERAHCKANLFDRAIHLLWRGAFLKHIQTLTAVLLNHAVTNEAVANTRYDT